MNQDLLLPYSSTLLEDYDVAGKFVDELGKFDGVDRLEKENLKAGKAINQKAIVRSHYKN